jgi:hypothetical protein
MRRGLLAGRRVAARIVAAVLLAAGLALPAVALARRRVESPTVLLFVNRNCPHCVQSAARFDASAFRLGVHAVLVADSGNWGRVAPHIPRMLDADHTLARALAIRAVPAMVTLRAAVRYDVGR